MGNAAAGPGSHLRIQQWLLQSATAALSIGLEKPGRFRTEGGLNEHWEWHKSGKGPLLKHTGEEHGNVIEGELEMQIGDELIRLCEGDSYSFDARIPHHGRNRADRVRSRPPRRLTA